MTAFLLLSIIGKALEIRRFIATSDLPARDNKERWAVKERGRKIPHREMRRRTGTHVQLKLNSPCLYQISLNSPLSSPCVP